MRTTLDIDDDLLVTAREIARRERQSLGKIISGLARKALAETSPGAGGFRPFPSRDRLVTNEIIDRLRDRTGA